MPTLVEETNSGPDMAPVVADPSELTLTVGGVTFSLTPSDNDAGLSYKRNGHEVLLSLSSFTGSIKVSLKGEVITAADSPKYKQPTATVEVESPVFPSGPKSKRGKASQTKLSFVKTTSTTKKTNKESKRTVELVTPSASAKKSRKAINHEPPNLGQTEKPTQEATQTQPDLSQTMSSQADDAAMSNPLMQQERTQSSGHSDVQSSTSVRDILDRVNNSNDDDSVATVPMEDDDDSVFAENSPQETTQAESETKMDDDKISTEAKESIAESPSAIPRVHPSPSPRWGHSMTKINGEKVLIYGGQSFDLEGNPVMLDDVHVYDMTNGSWNKPIQCRGDMRQWHSSTYLPERQLLITFGGETMDPIKKNKVITSNSLKCLDTDIMLWYPPAVSGDIPTGRSGHTATLLPNTNELVLIGGVKGARWLNTVSVLDTVRWVWTAPKVEGLAPKPRSYHSTTAVKGKGDTYKLVVFGGNNKTSCFNSVHVLESSEQNVWKWSNPVCAGKAPFPRTGHSATLLDDGKTICFYGGWDPNEEDTNGGEDNIFKGSFLLDTSTWTWSKGPKASPGGSGSEFFVEDCGPKRCGHEAALNAQTGEVMVFGGRIPGEILAGDYQRLPTSSSEQMVDMDEK
ncbi:unnamed protein product [Cylindrotheca closterium]|uniref:Uncharacterized protein n=1 Tax=Cylindrotheca closterium TaxID=2856 RepID=A0AAD2CN67_9STRA|nr:unnamed protein product [Cylindrotheca closterium]